MLVKHSVRTADNLLDKSSVPHITKRYISHNMIKGWVLYVVSIILSLRAPPINGLIDYDAVPIQFIFSLFFCEYDALGIAAVIIIQSLRSARTTLRTFHSIYRESRHLLDRYLDRIHSEFDVSLW
eukprot:871692_1